MVLTSNWILMAMIYEAFVQFYIVVCMRSKRSNIVRLICYITEYMHTEKDHEWEKAHLHNEHTLYNIGF